MSFIKFTTLLSAPILMLSCIEQSADNKTVNQAPSAFLISNVTGDTVTFSSNASDPEGDELNYNWNFGDSTYSNEVNPEHVYSLPGSYTVTLTVTDSQGKTVVTDTTFEVLDSTQTDDVTQTQTQTQTQSETQTDTDSNTSSETETETDGTTQTDSQTQTQSETVTDTSTQTQSNLPPIASFNYSLTATTNTYQFISTSTDPELVTLTYQWRDNGSLVSEEANPVLSLNDDGYHTINLVVSDGNSTSSSSIQILIGEGIETIQPVNLNLDLPVEYSLKNNGDILELGGNYVSDFYDDSTIETISIEFNQNDWQAQLSNNSESETFLEASLTYQGVTYSQVGVRYRGNTSESRAGNKKSFAVEMDWLIDGQDIDGYNFLKLNNAFEDPSNIREVLYNNLITDHVPAAKGSFVSVIVNGQDYGVFANVQKLDKDHVKEWFFDKDSARWRAESPNAGIGGFGGFGAGDSTLNNKGTQGVDYQSYYTLKGSTDALDPWQNLANAAYTMGTASQDTLIDDLNPYLDIDAALWFLVAENLFIDDDGYINKGGMDYFVYLDITTNRIMPIEYDGNSVMSGSVDDQSTGGGRPGGGNTGAWTPFHNENDTQYPLMNILLSNPDLRQRYLAHYRTFVEESFTPELVQAKIDEYYNLIKPYVNTATVREYSDAEFEAGITELRDLFNRRYTYVSEYSEMLATGIEILSVVDSVEGVESIRPTDAQAVLVQAVLSDQIGIESVNLYYGEGIVGTFEKIIMTDLDNDSVYEAIIPAHSKASFVRYYVEAIANDSASTITYSPAGAEHDVYIYQVQAAKDIQSAVVINELMSSNQSIVSDEQGEFGDWVELYNNADQPFDLSGYYLTDEDTNLTRWSFPQGTSIAAKSVLVVWLDDKETLNTGLHANFKLSSSGESLYLVTPELSFADSVTFTQSLVDQSYARTPNGTGDFSWINAPSYNEAN
ncbi:CotH kinase family protein [Marinicellulosiphila megalodicopiae]|uniref:CotH kinase family protein n=1 Tax=Marinicellulosiphila megalodicopiae TaxID=2724896 RepID=UPI003BAED23E